VQVGGADLVDVAAQSRHRAQRVAGEHPGGGADQGDEYRNAEDEAAAQTGHTALLLSQGCRGDDGDRATVELGGQGDDAVVAAFPDRQPSQGGRGSRCQRLREWKRHDGPLALHVSGAGHRGAGGVEELDRGGVGRRRDRATQRSLPGLCRDIAGSLHQGIVERGEQGSLQTQQDPGRDETDANRDHDRGAESHPGPQRPAPPPPGQR